MDDDRAAGEVHSTRAPEPVGSYPHARRAGGFLFLSGIGPRRRGSKEIPGVEPHDIEAQTRSVLDNVRAVLEEAGVRWEDIVDVTVFLTDMERDFAAFNRLYAEAFPGDRPRPTRTTVEVGALPTPIAVELKVIAFTGTGT
jgi:2-aminomuconate deaminase